MRERRKRLAQAGGDRTISRRRFIGVTAGATAALSFGTFIRSGLGAAKINVLTWSNTLNAMDDTLREQAKQYTKEKGVEVTFEFINQTDLPTKTAAAVESGAGPDIITTWSDGAHLHDKALIDVGDIAEKLGKELKGWTNIGKDIGFVGKTWKAVPWGIIPIAVVYRTDWCKEVGYEKFPDTYDDLLVMCKKLKDKGHPAGFALGRAIGDGNQSHYPMLWAFGGTEVKKDGKTVAINSPETAKAVDWRRRLFKEAETDDILSWDDSSNNRAFLSGAITATNNAPSIYLTASNQVVLDDKGEPLVNDIAHVSNPAGPAGVFHYHYTQQLAIPKYSKNTDAARDFTRWLMEKDQLSKYLRRAQAYQAAALKMYMKDPMWDMFPALKPYRDHLMEMKHIGWKGEADAKSARVIQNYVLIDMLANVAIGKMSPEESMKWGEGQLKAIYGG